MMMATLRGSVLVVLLLFVPGVGLGQVAAEPPKPVPDGASQQDVDQLQQELEALRNSQAKDRQRIEDLEKEVAKGKEKDKKKGGKKASVLGFYSASMTSTFSEKDPVNFALNEMEVDVGAQATKWLRFQADLQVRPESPDPEENRHSDDTAGGDPVDMLSGRRLLDHIAEQGFVALTLYQPMDFTIQAGKFNAEFSMDPFDQVDGNLMSRSLTHLHGIVQSLTGAKVGLNVIPELRAEVVVAEGWNVNVDTNDLPSFGGQIRLNLPGKLEAGLSGYYGEDAANASTDMVGLFTATDVPRIAISGYARILAFSGWKIAAEGCWGVQTITDSSSGTDVETDQSWYGGHINVDYEPFSWLNLAFRYELFGDDKSAILPLPVATTSGLTVHGPAIGTRLKLADRVFIMTELNAKLANEDVLTKPDGELGTYELFFGTQLLFRFGDVPDDGKKALSDMF